eukprot:1165060-Rhodomonas_salina.1
MGRVYLAYSGAKRAGRYPFVVLDCVCGVEKPAGIKAISPPSQRTLYQKRALSRLNSPRFSAAQTPPQYARGATRYGGNSWACGADIRVSEQQCVALHVCV